MMKTNNYNEAHYFNVYSGMAEVSDTDAYSLRYAHVREMSRTEYISKILWNRFQVPLMIAGTFVSCTLLLMGAMY